MPKNIETKLKDLRYLCNCKMDFFASKITRTKISYGRLAFPSFIPLSQLRLATCFLRFFLLSYEET